MPRVGRCTQGMFGCAGGEGIAVSAGAFGDLMVSSNISRTGAATAAATPRSPICEAPSHVELCSLCGSVDWTLFALKQFRLPGPAASARSARPLRTTTLPQVRFPRGRHGGPGSLAYLLNVTYLAV